MPNGTECRRYNYHIKFDQDQGSTDENRLVLDQTGLGPAKFRILGPGQNRKNFSNLGPGPNELEIGPTRTETINFQRSWTNLDQAVYDGPWISDQDC